MVDADTKAFAILRVMLIIGTYNYGVHMWGEQCETKEQAQKLANDLQDMTVNAKFLGIESTAFGMYSMYKMHHIYLEDVGVPDKNGLYPGVIVADCESVERLEVKHVSV